MITDFDKSQYAIEGERGLPENYPVPKNIDRLLFYIQRNLNKNTVVYSLNINQNGFINECFPMQVFWIKYTDGGVREELNYIQNKAFGYVSSKINNESFEFYMESYPGLRFFIGRDNNGEFNIFTRIAGNEAILNNIYVFANEFGLFPKVEYIELYGKSKDDGFPCYQKILI